MIQIYGSPRTSAGRCYLLLEELGISYQEVPIDMMGKEEHKGEAFLKLNPNGKVPCLVDDGFVLWESLAINSYLTEKYNPALLGSNLQEKALVQQWSIWALGDLQAPMVDILIQLFFVPEEKRDQALIKKSEEKIPGLLQILDQSLKNKDFILGSKISLADINLASVINITSSLKLDVTPYPELNLWFSRMKSRPSFQKFLESRKPRS